MKSLTVLTVNLKSDYPKYLIQSFEKFKPKDLKITYIVVENTDDTTYKDEVCAASNNVVWINNSVGMGEAGSINHGRGLNCGIKLVQDDWVFICDNDTVVTSSSFFHELFAKVEQGYSLVGTSQDPMRIKAVFATGFLVKSCIAKSVDLGPKYENGEQIWDSTNEVTVYVRQNNLKYYIFRNTWNDPSLVEVINEPYKSLGKTCGIDRCLDSEDKVMFVHLGRGTPKILNNYWKSGKKTYREWIEFINKEILSPEGL